MDTNQKEFNIKKLISNYSIETTPQVYLKYGGFHEFLTNHNDIYVTFLPNENSKNVIQTCKKINEEGLNAIPHLPARNIENNEELNTFIASLSEIAGCKKILLIAGSGKKKGSIGSSIEVLETGFLSKYNFVQVGVAGHPDGSIDISKKELDDAIISKNKIAKDVDYKIYIVTQFFFEIASFIKWEKHINKIGNQLDIHAGIPGPATLKTLISYAKSCGISNSIRFLSKQAFNLSKLATTNCPDKLITELSIYKDENSLTKLKKIHMYPFGGIKKTSNWINSINNSTLKFNSKNEFTII
ncbi:MAG: hypothetical protein CFH19_00588 [Alphaproteobacteria bacterium MarineAlpha5_Bin9]|nr:MAG: hypothetical protein CFH19_00588 [Alphaproteobacteria bacterium MarineAlpha5_Bin9]|tara:strand:- start:2098 stop:2994 length:897 start_codon:yes stop_codon:yes gene_type:complete